jgi:beta-lactamase regulating signal transducer with metallopeptidase domain
LLDCFRLFNEKNHIPKLVNDYMESEQIKLIPYHNNSKVERSTDCINRKFHVMAILLQFKNPAFHFTSSSGHEMYLNVLNQVLHVH